MAEQSWTGGCQCGAIRYVAMEKPSGAHICHCRMCQKQFGNFFAALVGVARDKFRLTRGEFSNFRSSADVTRGFCRDCGTPLTLDDVNDPVILLSIGSLDRHSDFMPEVQYGIESRETWFNRLHELPAYSSGEDASGPSEFGKRLPGIAASNRQHPDHDTQVWPTPLDAGQKPA